MTLRADQSSIRGINVTCNKMEMENLPSESYLMYSGSCGSGVLMP